ncbi:multidrug resistance efflux transporter family protein [Sporosarcina sp. PTS2304]|uniref:DMT family transporter n=1 Tax=Sporosarcina sp. PTS2304 TaxID=2283194 RepID=UPI000E0DE96E|nr:multidrug resistance efflux transporter family protein [Sporosarcina sp. PTS2304]AXI00834.1 multidrug resistance efflux transporter family protein [Sporosarcina sp. PTS2304]
MKAIGIGILSALFFAVTFVLNRSMELEGGSWLWSASLRYFFMVPFLVAIVALRGGLGGMKREMTASPLPFFGWSFVAFVLFYGPLTFAAGYSPGWLVAGTFQMTIVAGVLLAPFFTFQVLNKTGELQTIRHRIPIASLLISLIILAGVVLIQIPHASSIPLKSILLGTLPLVVAAFSYPLGNRKMMNLLNGRLDMFQRVLAMTLMTIPVWLLMAIYAWATVGPPSMSQVIQSLLIAISSGVIATSLFFMATDMVRQDQGKLAAVEATQSIELIFAMIGEMILLSLPLPSTVSLIGVLVIIGGMSLHSYQTALAAKR